MSIATPGSAGWHNDRGNALCDEFRFREAIAEYELAIALRPDFAEAYSNMGTALRDCGKTDAAIASHRHALQLRPDLAEAMNNLAIALRDAGQWEEALQCCERAIAMKPGYADAHANLGVILCEIERSDEAVAACRRAVELQPRRGVLQNNLGMILLKLGQYEEGWAKAEWRYFCDPRYPARELPKPRWDGGDLQGRTLLIHAEQGFGDTMQFARYVPLAAGRGGEVVFECYPELRKLCEGWKGVKVITAGEELPAFDVHCPIMSLPLALGTTLETILNERYLRADPARVEYWRRKLYESPSKRAATPSPGTPGEGGGEGIFEIGNSKLETRNCPHPNPLPEYRAREIKRCEDMRNVSIGAPKKIGLVWAGKPTHTDDRNRSMTLRDLAPLSSVDATFYSLQKGDASGQAKQPPVGMRLLDFTADFSDFAETAALIANLDLVIAVDTAVAHLAAAMGKPVWMLLPKVAEWRWMMKRGDTPWYPTMRLFRQEKWRDWTAPVERIAQLLKDG